MFVDKEFDDLGAIRFPELLEFFKHSSAMALVLVLMIESQLCYEKAGYCWIAFKISSTNACVSKDFTIAAIEAPQESCLLALGAMS